MKMHPVKSSHIEAIGHSGSTMHVTFKGGRTYAYSGVTPEAFEKFKNAESKGRHLRSMGITGTKLEEENKG